MRLTLPCGAGQQQDPLARKQCVAIHQTYRLLRLPDSLKSRIPLSGRFRALCRHGFMLSPTQLLDLLQQGRDGIEIRRRRQPVRIGSHGLTDPSKSRFCKGEGRCIQLFPDLRQCIVQVRNRSGTGKQPVKNPCNLRFKMRFARVPRASILLRAAGVPLKPHIKRQSTIRMPGGQQRSQVAIELVFKIGGIDKAIHRACRGSLRHEGRGVEKGLQQIALHRIGLGGGHGIILPIDEDLRQGRPPASRLPCPVEFVLTTGLEAASVLSSKFSRWQRCTESAPEDANEHVTGFRHWKPPVHRDLWRSQGIQRDARGPVPCDHLDASKRRNDGIVVEAACDFMRCNALSVAIARGREKDSNGPHGRI